MLPTEQPYVRTCERVCTRSCVFAHACMLVQTFIPMLCVGMCERACMRVCVRACMYARKDVQYMYAGVYLCVVVGR